MYNAVTTELIRQAPRVGDIDMERLPQELTKIYAKIVALRRMFNADDEEQATSRKGMRKSVNRLRMLANNLETLVVLYPQHAHYRSVAFVAGTARYLLLMIRHRKANYFPDVDFSASAIPSSVSAIILFMIANSPADAAELARKLSAQETDDSLTGLILKAVCSLAQGNLNAIVQIEIVKRDYAIHEIEQEAEDHLWTLILTGIKSLAQMLLGENFTVSAADVFRNVIDLAHFNIEDPDLNLESCYTGPYHLAKLLYQLSGDLLDRAVTRIPAPVGVDETSWADFLSAQAKSRPYLWENHIEAIDTSFLEEGNSAVLSFPTGAGKSTISELKIAANLLNDRAVIYLVPTHALEDQVKKNFQLIFGDIIARSGLEISGEYTEVEDEFPLLAVMTPERCLTLLSMAPEQFSRVGLVVFDEFHLINGRDDRVERRSLTAMFALLRLFTDCPDADYLLISAMVDNAEEIAAWIASVTSRPCIALSSKWKPTRQLHGCVVYQEGEVTRLKRHIIATQMTSTNTTPPKKLKEDLLIDATMLFSLKNIWDSDAPSDFFKRDLLKKKITLGISPQWVLTSNRNKVAAELAVFFAKQSIKTLVFVDNPLIAQSTANEINRLLEDNQHDRSVPSADVKDALDSLRAELGGLKHSYFVGSSHAAVHHGLMLPVERRLNESYFSHPEGVNIVTATATLAQGINLPAEVVIIAGDDRFDEENNARETVLAHEILNAAGRAGRAGTAAQGVVLLIPGKVITYKSGLPESSKWREIKDGIFSKSDQCLTINDPLTLFLDAVSYGDELSPDLSDLLFRLDSEESAGASIRKVFNRSLSAYRKTAAQKETFQQQVDQLIDRKNRLLTEFEYKEWISVVSLKTGAEPGFIEEMGESIENYGRDNILNFSVAEFVDWLFDWLDHDEERVKGLFSSHGAQVQLARALGLDPEKYTIAQIAERITNIKPLVHQWITGDNYAAINPKLPGRNDEKLSKARNFCLKLIPNLSFAFGTFSLVIRELHLSEGDNYNQFPFTIRALATFIREGMDTEQKLRYKLNNPGVSRVQCHLLIDIL